MTLQTLVAEGVDLISVSGTQGAAEVETHRVTLKLGILEAGQSALAILELRTSLSAQDGQVFVQQGTAYFDGGQATCNTVAFGMRPDHLPATGVEVAEP